MDATTLQKIRDSIANDKTDLALKLLKNYLIEANIDSDYLKLITIQESNYNSLKNSQMLGSINSSEFNIGINKIKINILDLIETLHLNQKKEQYIQTQTSNNTQKSKMYLIFLALFLVILFSGYTKYSFFRLFNNHISNEETQTDLLGKTVCLTEYSCWTFLSKDNFKELELVSEKIENNNYEKILRLKLEDAKSHKTYHMKLFLRYSFFFCFWQLEDKAVFEYYQIK